MDSFDIEVSANNGPQRFGVITVTAGGLAETVAVTQRGTVVEMHYRILVNSEGGTFVSNARINTATSLLDQAKDIFMEQFNVSLVREPGTSSPTERLNQRPGCLFIHPPNDICTPWCGELFETTDHPSGLFPVHPGGDDCTDFHHRSSIHLLGVWPGSRNLSHFKFVDFMLCYFVPRNDDFPWTGSHIHPNGVANAMPGNDMLVTTRSPNPLRTTTHEIAHLFGALDNGTLGYYCTDPECVMMQGSAVHNVWCNACTENIIRNRHRPDAWVPPPQ